MAPTDEFFTSQSFGVLHNPFLVSAGLILVYLVSTAIYRLYLSPLSSFPGPKIAALTSWYACYYDLVAGGQYIWVIEEMHKKYGPIVRIRPDVLSVNDPEFLEQLYAGAGKRREKYKTTIDPVYVAGSVLATKDHDLHRRRRAALNPFFSKQSVRRVEPIIQGTLSKLLGRMEEWGRLGSPAPMKLAYKATTKDIIHAYAFGTTHDKEFLDMKDLGETFFEIMEPSRIALLGLYFWWLNPLMAKLPPVLLVKLYPSLRKFIEYVTSLEEQISGIRAGKANADAENTVFHKILASDMPESEKSGVRLREEAYVIVVAGTETTAGTLAAITYQLLTKPTMLRKLKAELETAMPDPNERPVAFKLEGLPYLNAVIQEAIRRYPGVSHRLDRVAPDEDLRYLAPNGQAYTITAGTVVGMAPPLINRNERLYPSPLEFRPERFLENPKLLRYQFAFGKGSRICLGMNLAFQELYLIVAGIFRKYDLYDGTGEQKGPTLQLYETEEADVDLYADYITPGSKVGSKGVRLIIRN